MTQTVPAPVTAADMVAGQVCLDISCLDRIYLSGYCPGLVRRHRTRRETRHHRQRVDQAPPITRIPELREALHRRFRARVEDEIVDGTHYAHGHGCSTVQMI